MDSTIMVNSYTNLKSDILARYPGQTLAQLYQQAPAIASALNALPGVPVQGDTDCETVAAWLVSQNLYITLQTLATTAGPIQGGAAAFVAFLASGTTIPFRLSTPGIQALIAGFVSAGVITTAQQAAVLALGQTTPASYVQGVYGVPSLTAVDVDVALGQGVE